MAPSSSCLEDPSVKVIWGDIAHTISQNSLYMLSSVLDQVNVSSAVLKAAAHHYGAQCDKANKEFMLCRWEEKDPRKCLDEGRKVNECAIQFFRYIQYTAVPVCAKTQAASLSKCNAFICFSSWLNIPLYDIVVSFYICAAELVNILNCIKQMLCQHVAAAPFLSEDR